MIRSTSYESFFPNNLIQIFVGEDQNGVYEAEKGVVKRIRSAAKRIIFGIQVPTKLKLVLNNKEFSLMINSAKNCGMIDATLYGDNGGSARALVVVFGIR